MKRTLYEILGVDRGASAEAVADAYRQRLEEQQRAAHRDPNAMTFLREAYQILSDSARRAAYDASLAAAAERATRAQAWLPRSTMTSRRGCAGAPGRSPARSWWASAPGGSRAPRRRLLRCPASRRA